jgi:hypothetical protein
LRHQRKDVAGLHDVGRGGVLRHRRLHRTRAILRRDAGGDALGGLDRDGEGGAVLRLVVAHHQGQVELAAAGFGQRQADQSASPLGHEIDGFRRDVFSGEHEVAFIFAILLVDQDHHAAGAHVGDDIENRADAHG